MNPKHIKRHIVRKTNVQQNHRPDFSDAELHIVNEQGELIAVDREQRRLLMQAIQLQGVLLSAEQYAAAFDTTKQEIEEDIDYLYNLQQTARIRIGRKMKSANKTANKTANNNEVAS